MKLGKEYINYSVSRATLRQEDLILAYHGFLYGENDTELIKHFRNEVSDDIQEMFVDAVDLLNEGETDWSEDEYETMNEIIEALVAFFNEIAPDGCTFSSHPGDGSDFGFWEIETEEI